MKKIIILVLSLGLNFAFAAPVMEIALEKGLIDAASYSKKIEAKEADYRAAVERTRALRSDYWPSFFIDGQYKKVSEVPSMTLPAPINRTLELGQKTNYSAGLNLQYLLTDFGQTSKTIKGSEEEAKAQKAVHELGQEDLSLNLKNVYFKLAFQTSQLRSLLDAWSLAREQQKDMERRFRSGTSSRLDLLNASKETLNFKLKFKQMQREFSSALQDWMTLTGQKNHSDKLLHPLPEDLASRADVESSLAVKVLSYENGKELPSEVDRHHPALLQLEHLKLAQEFKSDASLRSYFPRITLGARSSLEYPLGGKDESYRQNAVFLNLSMPLWDGGKRSGQGGSFDESQRALDLQAQHLENEFNDNLSRMKNIAAQLEEEIQVAQEGGKEAEALAKLSYQSYINGRSNYLEVQSANLKVLDWKTQVDSLKYARSLVLAQAYYLGVKK